MKVGSSNFDFKKKVLAPPIPMERPSVKDIDKTNSLTFKLKSLPGRKKFASYKLTVPYFSTGTPEEVLLFFRGVEQVIVGQSIEEVQDKFSLIERLLNGDALATWKQAKVLAESPTAALADRFDICKKKLLEHVFPPLALKKQKKYLRSGIRKKRDQCICEFDARH